MKMTNMDEEKLLEEAHTPAVNQVRMDLAIAAIVKEEGIEVSEEDVAQEYEKMAGQFGMDVENVKKYMEEAVVRERLGRSKAIAVVVDAAVRTEPKPEESAAQAEKPEEESAAEGEKPKRKRAPRRKKAEESPEETAEGSTE